MDFSSDSVRRPSSVICLVAQHRYDFTYVTDQVRYNLGTIIRHQRFPSNFVVMIKFVAGAADGEAVDVQKSPDLTNQLYFVALIVTSVAATCYRFELREFLFPVPQHIGLDRT